MTEPTWTLDEVIAIAEREVADCERIVHGNEAIAWLRKLKDQRERLREALLEACAHPMYRDEYLKALLAETSE